MIYNQFIDDKMLFIIGAQKTGTSTMLAMLNNDPDIFMSFEWFIDGSYRNSIIFYQNYKVPQRDRMTRRNSIQRNFRKVYKHLNMNGFEYKYFGDKWPRLGPFKQMDTRVRKLQKIKTIFMVRDIRTWLTKPLVDLKYNVSDDIFNGAMPYVYYLIKSFQLRHCLRIKMENLGDLDFIGESVGGFLNIDSGFANEWWKSVGNYDDKNKMLHRWWKDHESSTRKFERQDTVVELMDHDAWKDILPLFDKYYNNLDGEFSSDEIKEDLLTVRSWRKTKGAVPMEECFKNIVVRR